MAAVADNSVGNNFGDNLGHNTHDAVHIHCDIPGGDHPSQGRPGALRDHIVRHQPKRTCRESWP